VRNFEWEIPFKEGSKELKAIANKSNLEYQ